MHSTPVSFKLLHQRSFCIANLSAQNLVARNPRPDGVLLLGIEFGPGFLINNNGIKKVGMPGECYVGCALCCGRGDVVDKRQISAFYQSLFKPRKHFTQRQLDAISTQRRPEELRRWRWGNADLLSPNVCWGEQGSLANNVVESSLCHANQHKALGIHYWLNQPNRVFVEHSIAFFGTGPQVGGCKNSHLWSDRSQAQHGDDTHLEATTYYLLQGFLFAGHELKVPLNCPVGGLRDGICDADVMIAQ